MLVKTVNFLFSLLVLPDIIIVQAGEHTPYKEVKTKFILLLLKY